MKGTQYRVLKTKIGVRVIERDELRTFASSDSGDILILPNDAWLENNAEVTGFIKWLTDWVEIVE